MAPKRPRFKVTAQGITWTLLLSWSFIMIYATDYLARTSHELFLVSKALEGLNHVAVRYKDQSKRQRQNLDQLIVSGDTSFSKGRFDEALGFYEHAMKLSPGDFDAFHSVMRTRAVIAAYHPQRITAASASEIVVAARIAERRDPESRDFYLTAIGNVELFGHDDLAAAEPLFRSALEHNPTNAVAKVGLGCLLATRKGEEEEARRYLVDGLEGYPKHAYGQLALARALLSSNEPVAASEHAVLADQLRSTPTTLLIAARALYLAKDAPKALAYAKRLMQVAPDQPAAPRIIGMLAGNAGNLPAAMANLRRAFTLSQDPQDLLEAAMFYEQADRLEEAARLVEEARSHDATNLNVLLRHASVLTRLQRHKAAVKTYEELLTLIDGVLAGRQTDELRQARAQVVELLAKARSEAVEQVRSR